ncbi:MAG: hypothetical protein RML12_10400 [Xanthomonadales bacterium]|nr:hypothetical protein [Xanthomonadales bacterium]
MVGILAAGKTRHASRPDPGTELLDEAEAARAEIGRLRAEGIEHVVLLTHVGLAMDLALARSLPAVDAIVGGDSHTLLGEGLAALGLRPAGPYPIVVGNAEGDPGVRGPRLAVRARGRGARGRVRRPRPRAPLRRSHLDPDRRPPARRRGPSSPAAEREAVLARLAPPRRGGPDPRPGGAIAARGLRAAAGAARRRGRGPRCPRPCARAVSPAASTAPATAPPAARS